MDASDNIFSEFEDQDKELHRLLVALERHVPDGHFQLISRQGGDIYLEKALSLPREIRKNLVDMAREKNGLVHIELADGVLAHAIPINKLNALLLFVLPEQLSDPSIRHYGATLVQLCIDLFLSQKTVCDEQAFSLTQKRQLDRKIRVLQSQYHEILEDNQQEYRRIIDSIEDGYYEIDLAGRFTFFNRSLSKIFGYNEDELTGINSWELMDSRGKQKTCHIFNQVYKTGASTRRHEFVITRKDGLKSYIEISISLMKDRENQPIGFQGIARDITKRVLADEALHDSEEKFRAIASSILDALIMMDHNGNVSFWNKGAERIFGYTKKETIGKYLHKNIVPKKFYEDYLKGFKRFRHDGQGNAIGKTVELTALRKDGTEFPIEFSLSSLKIKNEWDALGILRDISERKKMEEELINTNQQLENAITRANEMALEAEVANQAKSEFLANMSHEIRTPMNAVLGFTDILLDTKLDKEQIDYVNTIKRSGESLLSLINDILDFSKIEAGQLDLEEIDFDPELIAYDVCELIRPKIEGKPIEILCHIGDRVPSRVKGDPLRFRQALTNLMGNAPKFTESGEIELSLDVEEERDNLLKFHAKIRDTGIGIPEDKLSSIFAPFQQADGSTTRKYGGTGLGLSICKQISELMNGDVWVESAGEGRGSTFHFTAWLKKTKNKGKKTKRYRPAFLSGRNILIVDDNRNNLKILRHTLELGKMSVVALTDAKDVIPTLEKAVEQGKPFDLCLCDIQMPDIDGYKLAKKIRSSGSKIQNIPLIALSSLMARNSKECKNAGFNGFLSKPISRRKLLQMMKRILGEEYNKARGTKQEAENSIVTQYSVREDIKHSVHILLAEDNPVNQKLAKIMLGKAGYQIEIANNGREAVEKYTTSPRDFDLIFMDIQMPEMDGWEATQEIRNWENRAFKAEGKKNRIPIVAMTAHAMKGDQGKCLAAGMDDYVSKPIKRELVFNVIEKWVLREKKHECQ